MAVAKMTRPARLKPRAENRIAAIDIGSNAVRFALAKVSAAGGLEILEEKRRPTRLGANLAKGAGLPKAAVKATLGAVKEFCFDAMRHGVGTVRLVATAAVRESPDGGAFVARLEREVGLPVSIIGPDEEARLAFASCRASYDVTKRNVAVVDIGGGSVQVSRAWRGVLYEAISMPLGAVRLTAAFGGGEEVRKADVLRKMRRHVAKVLADGLRQGGRTPDVLIGCGGTFATVALLLGVSRPAVRAGTRPASLARLMMACERLKELTEEVCAMSQQERDERLRRANVPPDRAEILPAGLMVATELMKHIGAPGFVAHAGGVRDGILRELAGSSRVASPVDEVRAFAEGAGYEYGHSEHVGHLAVALLNDLADVDRIREAVHERMDASELLECAGLVHDLGVPIDYERHHKVSRRIVELAAWRSLDSEMRAVLANLARYHRKALPTEEHPPFAALSRRSKQLVRALAGILRVADGLDRQHRQRVHGVRVRITARAVEIVAEGAQGGDADIRAAQKKSDLLAAVLRRSVVVRAG